MRIVFMGTPDFAVPSLEGLIADGHEVRGVFTQPDKPKNRGMKLTPSPVKVTALAHDIPVFQPNTLKTIEALDQLQALAPDLIAVAAYGKLLPQEILGLPRLGCVNVHSSLLPKYRGAAPIHWAILNGETETGVTIQHMAVGLDTGDVILSQATPIDPDETVEQLYDRLAQIGGGLLCQAVKQLEAGTAQRIPQDDSLSSYAPKLSRELSPVDWNRSAKEIHNQVRALIPWPAASTELGGVKFKLFSVTETGEQTGAAPGTVLRTDKKGIYTACGDRMVLRIDELQAEGGKRMRSADYLRGHPMAF